MLIIISPSKGQNFTSDYLNHPTTIPERLQDSIVLINELRKLSVTNIQNLMLVSENIAELNFQRYKNFTTPFTLKNSKPAFFAFIGEVYSGFSKAEYKAEDLDYAQQHLRILSGLYGALRPLDLIQAYRLEMKTKLENAHGNNLYKFWGERISQQLNSALDTSGNERYLLNLASNEYFKAVRAETINGTIINIHFHELKADKSRTIAVYAKKARGLMSDYILRERISNINGVKDFSSANYKFSVSSSAANNLVFVRPQPVVK